MSFLSSSRGNVTRSDGDAVGPGGAHTQRLDTGGSPSGGAGPSSKREAKTTSFLIDTAWAPKSGVRKAGETRQQIPRSISLYTLFFHPPSTRTLFRKPPPIANPRASARAAPPIFPRLRLGRSVWPMRLPRLSSLRGHSTTLRLTLRREGGGSDFPFRGSRRRRAVARARVHRGHPRPIEEDGSFSSCPRVPSPTAAAPSNPGVWSSSCLCTRAGRIQGPPRPAGTSLSVSESRACSRTARVSELPKRPSQFLQM